MPHLEPYAYQEGDPWPIMLASKSLDEDWIDYLEFAENYAPALALSHPLPNCACGEEVQPGEEVCTKCLGEYDVQAVIDELIRSSYPTGLGNATGTLQTYYSNLLLDRLVPALTHADHGLTNLP